MTQELLLNCDWLGLSLHIAGEPKPVEGYIWREYTATNVWNKRRVLWTENGDRVLTLLSEPRSAIISSSAALCEIENEWLYHGGGHRKILDVLEKSVFFNITGISRLDLAVDFCPTEAQKEVIFGLADGEYYIGGKANRVPWWAKVRNNKLHPMWNGKNIPYDQSWGHKTTDIKWKLYYKTKELLDAGGGKFMMKPYIVDQWRLHGMDIRNVWRVEVSVKKCNNYLLYGNRLDLGQIEANFEELFCQLYQSRFQVKLNEGHKDRTNDKQITFLPIDKIIYTLQKRETENERQHNGRITLMRHLVQSLDDEQVLLDRVSRENVYNHIYQIIERDNLNNYFNTMTGQYFEEWVAKKEAEAAGSEVYEIEKPKQNTDIKPNPKAEERDPEAEQRYWRAVDEKIRRDLKGF